MFHSPECETALEIGHFSNFSIGNSQFSWTFHFHNSMPYLSQEVELKLLLPATCLCLATSSLPSFANLLKTIIWQKTSSLKTYEAGPRCFFCLSCLGSHSLGRVSKPLACTLLAVPKPVHWPVQLGWGCVWGHVHKLLARESFIQVTPFISLSIHIVSLGLKTGVGFAVPARDLGF